MNSPAMTRDVRGFQSIQLLSHRKANKPQCYTEGAVLRQSRPRFHLWLVRDELTV